MPTHIAGHAARERSAGIVAAIAALCVNVNATYVVAATPEAAEDNTTIFFFVICNFSCAITSHAHVFVQ